MSAPNPQAYVTAIPGRFSPILLVDKRDPATIAASTTTSAQMAYMFRTETANNDFNVPLTPILELGTSFRVGDVDDIPDNKMTLNSYDVGCTNLSLITGKKILSSGTTNFQFQDLNNTSVDVIRQYASPAGDIFYSEYMGDHVVEEANFSYKAKGTAMENFSLVGFNTAGFRGLIQTKAYVVQSADVTNGYLPLGTILGSTEAVYQIPVPGSGPASYWQQTGRLYFLKIERWQASTGWVRFPETAGSVAAGYVKYTSGSKQLAFNAGDTVVGDLWLVTYCTYVSDVTALSPLSGISGIVYNQIAQATLDSTDPVAVPTRLTPITISANSIARGTDADFKLSLKRERVEGIGDTDGLFSPSDAPELALSLSVRMTDAGLNGILENGTPLGSNNGGATSNDFFSPEQATRNQLASAMPLVIKLYDPRNATSIVKTITSANAVFNQRSVQDSAKGPVTVKYSGHDYVGNVTASVTH